MEIMSYIIGLASGFLICLMMKENGGYSDED